MPSPFPGVDPYIEESGFWGGFHGTLNVDIKRALNRDLPQRYAAEIELYVWIHEPDAARRMVGRPEGLQRAIEWYRSSAT